MDQGGIPTGLAVFAAAAIVGGMAIAGMITLAVLVMSAL
jgi:hypothetical protein